MYLKDTLRFDNAELRYVDEDVVPKQDIEEPYIADLEEDASDDDLSDDDNLPAF